MTTKRVIYRVYFVNSLGDERTRTFTVSEGVSVWTIVDLYSKQNPIIGVAVAVECLGEARHDNSPEFSIGGES